MQTLTLLNLSWNEIGDNGAQYLSDALQNNTVNHFQSTRFYAMSSSFFTDPHHT